MYSIEGDSEINAFFLFSRNRFCADFPHAVVRGQKHISSLEIQIQLVTNHYHLPTAEEWSSHVHPLIITGSKVLLRKYLQQGIFAFSETIHIVI